MEEERMNDFSADPGKQQTELPMTMRNRVIKQYLGAAVIAAVTIVCMIVFKSWGYAIGFLGSAYIAWLGNNMSRKWYNGQIICEKMVCLSAKRVFLSDWVVLVLRRMDAPEGDETAVRTYNLSANRKDIKSIERGMVLNIYYDKEYTSEIIAWSILDVVPDTSK